ncbi:hypothetical protein BGZ98_005759 [Dissophora globulifera]|nr:hypothetical protein BGZ98_005759 [Dissophora globulifera]
MGSSASKATSTAKSAARHFPKANVMQERAANPTGKVGASRVEATTSPKQDYLEDQRRLEEEVARYEEQISQSSKLAGESRPPEDTPSAAQLQFFGNLRSIGQVQVPNPEQIKHHEAEEILKRKLPVKPISSSSASSSSSSAPAFAQSLPVFKKTSTSNSSSTSFTATPNSAALSLTSLKLMELLQLRNQDPSIWTVDRLSEEFGVNKNDIQTLTKYVNTYAILPGKDAKGREHGVWCEDLRGVEVLDKPSSIKDAEETSTGSIQDTASKN